MRTTRRSCRAPARPASACSGQAGVAIPGHGGPAELLPEPYGAGWALVGDAGYHRDFITGLGITDAFRDAELLTNAIDAGFAGRQPLDEALAAYESERNEIATPMFEFTIALARMDAMPSPEIS